MAGILDKFGGGRARAKRLRDFLYDCAGSAPCEEADRVREAVQLLGGGGIDAAAPLDHARIEVMLACDAAMNAVLEILGPDMAFMLSRGGNEACLATVVPPGRAEEAVAEGSTLALAMLAGHVAAVLARLETEEHVAEAQIAPASMRLH
ncbi:hypothetical protein [Novosphingobium resinovorum]|uniref:hypothetical protein n=1 Tax=Novosphingobium resinovorum TaxID=158500 RepID=UPI002ED2D5E3|nr:hypothetical protein [Novosphingobium resinovorum]